MKARRAVVDWTRRYIADAGLLADIALAVTEATTNAVVHAYRGGDTGSVVVETERRGEYVCIYVRDSGSGLAPRVDSPGLGLGLGLIAQVADGAEVRSPEGGGTEVAMRFNLSRAHRAAS